MSKPLPPQLAWMYRFCDPQTSPATLSRKPFVITNPESGDHWLCATNGRLMVALVTDDKDLAEGVTSAPEHGMVLSLLTEPVLGPVIDLAAMKRWLGKPVWEKGPCYTCGCSGKLHPKPGGAIGSVLGFHVNKNALAAALQHLHGNRVAAKVFHGPGNGVLHISAAGQWQVISVVHDPPKTDAVEELVDDVMTKEGFPPPSSTSAVIDDPDSLFGEGHKESSELKDEAF